MDTDRVFLIGVRRRAPDRSSGDEVLLTASAAITMDPDRERRGPVSLARLRSIHVSFLLEFSSLVVRLLRSSTLHGEMLGPADVGDSAYQPIVRRACDVRSVSGVLTSHRGLFHKS